MCRPVESSELTEVSLSGQADAGIFEEESGAARSSAGWLWLATRPSLPRFLRAPRAFVRRPSWGVLSRRIEPVFPRALSRQYIHARGSILLSLSLLGHVTFIVREYYSRIVVSSPSLSQLGAPTLHGAFVESSW